MPSSSNHRKAEIPDRGTLHLCGESRAERPEPVGTSLRPYPSRRTPSEHQVSLTYKTAFLPERAPSGPCRGFLLSHASGRLCGSAARRLTLARLELAGAAAGSSGSKMLHFQPRTALGYFHKGDSAALEGRKASRSFVPNRPIFSKRSASLTARTPSA